MITKGVFAIYFRNFIFGVEDSLASTVGLLSGIAIADVDRRTILVTGLVLIFVEAFSMAIGSFLSEQFAEDYIKQGEVPIRHALIGSVIMFASYLIAGLMPIWPYAFLDGNLAFWVSIGGSLLGLFLVGLLSGKISNTKLFNSSLRMMLIGGMAVLVGVIVGQIANH